MISSVNQRVPDASRLTPEQVAHNSTLSEHDKVAEMSRQFESVLLRQILAEAHKPVFKSTMSLGSGAASIHQDMIVTEMANQVTRGGGTGLAKQLTRDLARQLPSAKEDTKACEAHARQNDQPLFQTPPSGTTSSARWIR